MEEILKDVKGFEGIYKVSNLGNVYRVAGYKGGVFKPSQSMKKMKQGLSRDGGRSIVNLSNCGIQKIVIVHRLVYSTFVREIDRKTIINHKDGNLLNNSVSNLEETPFKGYNTRIKKHTI